MRIKNIPTKKGDKLPYAYLCKSIREGNKVKQITIKYLGRVKGLKKIKKEKIKELFEKYKYKCNLCNKEKNLIIDHIVPLSKGGTNDFKNLQILCQECNQKKGKK